MIASTCKPNSFSRVRANRTRVFIVMGILAFAILLAGSSGAFAQEPREYYLLQTFHTLDEEKLASVLEFLEKHHVPALRRAGASMVGAFSGRNELSGGFDAVIVVPFDQAAKAAETGARLADDREYQAAVEKWSQYRLEEPPFTRMEIRLLKAFAGMPALNVPEPSTAKTGTRVFELRLYESHTLGHARKKIEMFDSGEIGLMRDAGLAPVFFAECLAGSDMPCLIYMLSAADAASHQEHWTRFLDDPRWSELRDRPEYRDTVSRIRSWQLAPAPFSDL